ncbi:MAG: hypothetical protein WD059_02405 [Balneolaceae bacterium]
MRSIRYGLAVLVLSLVAVNIQAQQVFERVPVEVSNLGISFTTVGTIGNPSISSIPTGTPSMEYPKNSGTEHLFEAGIWLGANVGGQTRVSTAAVATSSGYSTGAPNFEFTNDGTTFSERSSLEESPNYSPNAVSHQDLIAQFTDRNTTINGQPISGHDNPLFADVTMESYNWSFGFAEATTIVKYEITNNDNSTWNDFYFGMYSDMVVRNVNTTTETGSNFFNKNGLGWLDDLYALYIFDRGSFDVKQNTHAATVILGSEYRGVEFHPRRAEEVQEAGLPVPNVRPDFWLFSSGSGDFSSPNEDLDKYNRMSTEWPLETHREDLRNEGLTSGGNFIQLNTIGPFPEIAAGETVTIYMAFVAAVMPDEFQSLVPGNVTNVDELDNEESRANLVENIEWAYRLFDGQENEDGTRTRFLVPEPPVTPNMRVELTQGTASIYWDDRAESSVDPVTEEEDFAGYKLYRTQLGDDIRGNISSDAKVLREWDIQGDDSGFETGLDEVRLQNPISFPDDPNTEYNYRFDISGMLSGWQYLFSVSAFDRGDDQTPSLETSVNANAVRVFPGTPVNENFNSDEKEFQVGVYPNPYRVNAAWDGNTPFTRKIMFYNLPRLAEVRVYTLAGEIVATLDHNADTYTGDIRWFNDYSSDNRIMPGGEHAWDLLSEANQNLATGLYLYTVYDKDSGEVQQGRFAIIK